MAAAAAGSDVEIGGAERAIRLLEHGLDLELGFGEPLAGSTQALNAFLEEDERVVELGIVGLELADDLLELRELGREGGGRGSAVGGFRCGFSGHRVPRLGRESSRPQYGDRMQGRE